jgi:hypothetical protein
MKDLFVALIGVILVSTFALSKKLNLVENFWQLPARTIKIDKEYSLKSQDEHKYGAPMYSVPPNYQSVLTPRFSNVDYGAYIRYNLPNMDNLASPQNPLTYGPNMLANLPAAGMPSCNQVGMGERNNMENYEPILSFNQQRAPQMPANPQQAAMMRQQTQAMADMGVVKAREQPPVSVQSAGGLVEQPIVYDRFVFANQKSRLYGLGDPIRGDVKCNPVQDGWFRPSVHPNIDLRAGAMQILNGINNDIPNQLSALQAEYSHGYNKQNAYEQVVAPALAQKELSLGAGQGDINVVAFP